MGIEIKNEKVNPVGDRYQGKKDYVVVHARLGDAYSNLDYFDGEPASGAYIEDKEQGVRVRLYVDHENADKAAAAWLYTLLGFPDAKNLDRLACNRIMDQAGETRQEEGRAVWLTKEDILAISRGRVPRHLRNRSRLLLEGLGEIVNEFK